MEGEYLLGLTQFLKFGPIRIKKLAKFFESDFKSAFFSSENNLIKAGIEAAVVSEFIEFRKKINISFVLENLQKEKVNYVFYYEDCYPKLLKEIYDPPAILYYKGILPDFKNFNLAIVGSRKNTFYGEKVINELIKDLVFNNFSITSGLALGIDGLAHKTTLENNGQTIAVVASGLDRKNIYPKFHLSLFDEIIAKKGVVFSELPLKTEAFKFNFPRRNRLISGLAHGVLVIEAEIKSGSLITAYSALDQNREVFSIPGNINNSSSAGTNQLIKNGAKLVSGVNDILECFSVELKNKDSQLLIDTNINLETEEERIIWSCLLKGELSIDELKNLTNIDTRIINATLTIMEIKGLIKSLSSSYYSIVT